MFFFSLHKVCSYDGRKKVMTMEKNAIVFTLNSSSLKSPYFSCHLDLLIPSANDGYSEFIEEISDRADGGPRSPSSNA